jgi:Ni/Co efflux regulator RcnB
MKKLVCMAGAAALVAMGSAFAQAPAESKGDVRKDTRDIRQDLRKDKRDLRKDKRERREDVKAKS